jgi:hypothetical protein
MHADLWWLGPAYLKLDQTHWPNQPDTTVEEKVVSDHQTSAMVTQTRQNAFNISNRYSTMNKLLGVIAYCLRFVENCKLSPNQRRGGELTPNELDQA